MIGINDYCSIELQSRKNPNGVRINFHIFFDNDASVLTKISTWLASLKCLDEKENDVQLGTVSDFTKISFDFDYVIKSLKAYHRVINQETN